MAKKRKDRDSAKKLPFASEAAVPVYLPSIPKSSLSDLRFYQPSKPKIAFDDLGRRARVLQQPVNRNLSRPRAAAKTKLSIKTARLQEAFRERLSFAESGRVLVCVRRKTRREVLFAKRSTGRGAKSRVRYRNAFSNIRC